VSGGVLICGSRTWTDRGIIDHRIAGLPVNAVVIHGGAKGADTMAGEAARAQGLHTAVVEPLWDLFGNAAGHRRNHAMLALRPSLVIAFTHGSRGTQGTIDEARKLGIPVEIYGRELQAASLPSQDNAPEKETV
jgi:hypothetical protein